MGAMICVPRFRQHRNVAVAVSTSTANINLARDTDLVKGTRMKCTCFIHVASSDFGGGRTELVKSKIRFLRKLARRSFNCLGIKSLVPVPAGKQKGGGLFWKILPINTLRPRHYGRSFSDDSFKCILVNENVWTLIEISLKYIPGGRIGNNPT